MSLPTSSLHLPLLTPTINRKITWTLRFPLPAPAEGDPQNHRFADLALYASGHHSAAALRNALQLATTTAHQTMSHPTLASSASPTQPTVTTCQPLYYIIGRSVMPHTNAYSSTAPQLLRVAFHIHGQHSRQKWEWGRPGHCSRSSTVRRGPENSPLLGSPFLWCARQWNSDDPGPPARGFTLLGRKAGTSRKPGLGPLHQPWKRSMARSLGIRPRGPALRQRKNKKMTKEDKLTGRQTGAGQVGERGKSGGGQSTSATPGPSRLSRWGTAPWSFSSSSSFFFISLSSPRSPTASLVRLDSSVFSLTLLSQFLPSRVSSFITRR